jgi:hypothetical protein
LPDPDGSALGRVLFSIQDAPLSILGRDLATVRPSVVGGTLSGKGRPYTLLPDAPSIWYDLMTQPNHYTTVPTKKTILTPRTVDPLNQMYIPGEDLKTLNIGPIDYVTFDLYGKNALLVKLQFTKSE